MPTLASESSSFRNMAAFYVVRDCCCARRCQVGFFLEFEIRNSVLQPFTTFLCVGFLGFYSLILKSDKTQKIVKTLTRVKP